MRRKHKRETEAASAEAEASAGEAAPAAEKRAAESEDAAEAVKAEPVDAAPAEPGASARGTDQEDAAPDAEILQEEDVAGIIEERNSLREELAEAKDRLLRMQAEFENFRKRTRREAERTRERAAEGVIRDILPIIDHLDLALEHSDSGDGGGQLAKGVQMVRNQLQEALARHGLEDISTVGVAFDPNEHEAVIQTHSEDVPENQVAQEFQRGYRLGSQVLRPAKVVVSQGAPGENAPEGGPETGSAESREQVDESNPESARIDPNSGEK